MDDSNVACAARLTFNILVKHGKLSFRSQSELFIACLYRLSRFIVPIVKRSNRISRRAVYLNDPIELRLLTPYLVPFPTCVKPIRIIARNQ